MAKITSQTRLLLDPDFALRAGQQYLENEKSIQERRRNMVKNFTEGLAKNLGQIGDMAIRYSQITGSDQTLQEMKDKLESLTAQRDKLYARRDQYLNSKKSAPNSGELDSDLYNPDGTLKASSEMYNPDGTLRTSKEPIDLSKPKSKYMTLLGGSTPMEEGYSRFQETQEPDENGFVYTADEAGNLGKYRTEIKQEADGTYRYYYDEKGVMFKKEKING